MQFIALMQKSSFHLIPPVFHHQCVHLITLVCIEKVTIKISVVIVFIYFRYCNLYPRALIHPYLRFSMECVTQIYYCMTSARYLLFK